MTPDHMRHSLQILEHCSVLKPQHSNIEPGQVFTSNGVVLRSDRVEVLLPVEFDR